MADRIQLGVIVGAHGLKGDVRVKSFTAAPGDIAAYGPLTDAAGEQSFALRVVRATDKGVIARIRGVTGRTEAERLKGTELYISREALPEAAEEEYYFADLIGLAARRPDGSVLGTVRAVNDFGAGAVIEILAADGTPVLLPFTEAYVPVVDLASGAITVDAPEDLIRLNQRKPKKGGGEDDNG